MVEFLSLRYIGNLTLGIFLLDALVKTNKGNFSPIETLIKPTAQRKESIYLFSP